MKRMAVSLGAAAAAATLPFLASVGACSHPSESQGPASPQSETRALITRVQSTWSTQSPSFDGRVERTLPLVAAGQALRFEPFGGGISPAFGPILQKTTGRLAQVTLPSEISSPFRVADVQSGLTLAVGLEGVTGAAAEIVDGLVVFRNAIGSSDRSSGRAHVIHRAHPEGTEDWVVFDEAPAIPRLTYRVSLARGVAGLRKIDDVLEFLDSSGDPKLRVTAPLVMGADGKRHEATLRVEGCAYDTNPRAPWGRPVVAPGASYCTVVVGWGHAEGRVDPKYPALVDPSWTSTGGMTVKRWHHIAAQLDDGRVLVAGGQVENTTVHQSAELYNPASGTFASTGKMVSSRTKMATTFLGDGRVMVSGGMNSAMTTLATAEAFDPNLGSWAALASMTEPRSGHTLTVLVSGEVLAAGGEATGVLKSAELYNVVGNSWVATQPMTTPRVRHTATALDDGRVLVTGGENGVSPLSSAERYFRTSETWTATPPMVSARASHTATLLDNKRVLVAGGDGAVVVQTAQLWDNESVSWINVPDLTTARRYHSASKLINGRVVVVGGYTGGYLQSAEIFDPGGPLWDSGGSMKTGRSHHKAVTLNNGKVLVTGGQGSAGTLTSCELFELQKNGQACLGANECTSGFCVDGVCCDNECAGLCMACTALLKGQGTDGSCEAIKAGTDPADECEQLGSGACQTLGTCDGNGACATQGGLQCQAASCLDGTNQANPWLCDTLGECKEQGSSSCLPYLCANNACLKTCTSANDCETGGACILTACVPKGGNGTPCGGNFECTNGNCVEGVCCDTPCNGQCQSCREANKDSGPDGVCGQVKTGVACGTSTCIGGVQNGDQCTATGTCEPASIPCAPYLCADAYVCSLTCTLDSECKSGNYCDNGACKPRLDLGGACAENKQCLSGFCTDWVCCDKACGGNVNSDCLGCSKLVGASADGKCTELDGTPCLTGTCSTGICLDTGKDAGQDAKADVGPDAPLADTGTDGPKSDAKTDGPSPEGSAGASGAAGAGGAPPADGGAGSTTDAAAGAAGAAPPAPGGGDEGGCGCRTAGTSSSPWAWLSIAGAVAAVLSRRKR